MPDQVRYYRVERDVLCLIRGNKAFPATNQLVQIENKYNGKGKYFCSGLLYPDVTNIETLTGCIMKTLYFMKYFSTRNTSLSAPGKAFSLVIAVLVFAGLLASCEKDDPAGNKGPLAGGYSILVHNGNVLVSGFRSENGQVSTKYWINGENAGQPEFAGLLGNQSAYRQAIDDRNRTVYQYKDGEGAIQDYRFDQGGLAEEGRIFYYQNDSMVRMDNDSIGVLSSVTFYDDKPVFAGSLGEMSPGISGNMSYYPRTAFVWDGHSPLTELLLPEQSTLFWGASTIYTDGSGECYVGGLCGVPMYWENTDPVVLDERFGEVWQITKSGSDVYAVGLINKYNSNSSRHTACYWKNGELYELEDDAQAYGIFVDGDDIYVSGAVGDVPVNYRPCYWKNGIRVDLPM